MYWNTSRRLVQVCLLAGTALLAAPAAAQTFEFSGTRENNNPLLNPPGGRCVPQFFNTVLIAPGATSSTGTSNLGPFTSTQSHCVNSAPPTPLSDGRFTYTFRAGDTITGTYSGAATNSATPGVFNATENLVITGGTGRFTGASGTISSTGQLRIGPGPSGLFSGTLTGAIDASATVAGEFATALGEPAAATGRFSTSVGTLSIAAGERSVALGSLAEATAAGAIAIGDASLANALNATAVGQATTAQGIASTAIGHNADATALASFAGGVSAQATGIGSTALGRLSAASGLGGVALGASSVSSADGTVAIGESSLANQLNAVAVGQATTAQGVAATAIGHNADATALASFAGGVSAQATATGSTALGRIANASAANATALGAASSATFAGSTAIGTGAATTAANQVSLGGTGSSVRVGDVAASTAAQTGALNVATLDAAGTLGRGAAVSSFATAAQVQALDTAQVTLSGRVDDLFDLRDIDRRDMRQGIAAAVAMGHASMPSAPGRTSYVLNGAVFRGEVAIGGSIMHRIGGENPLAIGIGFSFAGNKNNAVRAGLAGEF